MDVFNDFDRMLLKKNCIIIKKNPWVIIKMNLHTSQESPQFKDIQTLNLNRHKNYICGSHIFNLNKDSA